MISTRAARSLAASLFVVVVAASSIAEAKPPTLERFYPPGGQRGQTVSVTAAGSFDHWPAHAWSDDPGIEIKAEKEKRQLSIKITEAATPGLHWIRLNDEEGATALRPFLVGTLPEVVVVESDDNKPTALESSQVTVTGRLGRRGDVDEFSLALKKGQTLVAAVDANRVLGSPMDAVLQVATPEGFVLAQNDDDQGFDPRLTLDVPADGSYVVRLFAFPATPDSTINFAGGDSYVYRLTLTTGGYLDHGYPLAVPRANPGEVEAHGWNVPEQAKRLPISTEANQDTVTLRHPDLANTVKVQVVSHPALTEQKSTDPAHPQVIPIPSTVTGRIAAEGEQDVYNFTGKKGQGISLQVDARSLGAPLDPVLRVSDAQGKILNDVDDNGNQRDVRLAFTPPADGTYKVSIRDLHGRGGERFVYRLTVAVPEPDFQLTLKSDRLTLTPGTAAKLEVAIERKNGFKAPIEVRLEGLPEGLSAAPLRSEAGKDTEKAVTFSLNASGALPSGRFRVLGTATGNEGAPLERAARSPIEGFEVTTEQPWLTVLKPAASKAP